MSLNVLYANHSLGFPTQIHHSQENSFHPRCSPSHTVPQSDHGTCIFRLKKTYNPMNSIIYLEDAVSLLWILASIPFPQHHALQRVPQVHSVDQGWHSTVPSTPQQPTKKNSWIQGDTLREPSDGYEDLREASCYNFTYYWLLCIANI